MKDFSSYIGQNADEIRNTRVENMTRTIKDESEILINKLKVEYRKKQNELEEALDLAPTSTTDLATNLKNLNPTEFISKIYTIADEMSILARRIKIRVKIHNTLFPKENGSSVKDLTKEELDFLHDVAQ